MAFKDSLIESAKYQNKRVNFVSDILHRIDRKHHTIIRSIPNVRRVNHITKELTKSKQHG